MKINAIYTYSNVLNTRMEGARNTRMEGIRNTRMEGVRNTRMERSKQLEEGRYTSSTSFGSKLNLIA
jgi:hypothetical protein